jgi:hypothetical protein
MRTWHPPLFETRLAGLTAASYDRKTRSVDTTISKGSPVKRFYGLESLRITRDAVITDRVDSVGVPLLDSHNQSSISNVLGRVAELWFERGALMGKLAFAETVEGRKAEKMVARREIGAVSPGYRVLQWEITDEDGRVLDPEKDRIGFDDDLNFEATKWEILEVSLAAVPADAQAAIRSFDAAMTFPSIFREVSQVSSHVRDARARMQARERMQARNRMLARTRV